jgi:FKBP-type peptidyl-prolyl cis-trans isomerase FkpA
MKRILFALAIAGTVWAASCEGDNRYPGYEKVENGTYFIVHKPGTGTELADTGGAMFIKIKFKTEKDSVFMDINMQTMKPSFPLGISKPKFTGDFMDMFMRLHVGDSVSFFVNMDSLQANYPHEFEFGKPEIDTMQYLGFTVKVDSIWSRRKMEGEKAKADAEEAKQRDMMMKRNAVMGPIQKKAKEREADLRKNDAKLLKSYLAKHKFPKPDSNGVYFREDAPGTGGPLMPGMIVSVRYTGMYLDDSTIFDSNRIVEGEDPLEFQLGSYGMIPGFANSVAKMKVGGKATFIVPPKMGYQDSLTRVFDVEVIEAKDGGPVSGPPMPRRR